MILLQPDVKKKVILILLCKLTAYWKYVRIGLEHEICIVDKILRYGRLFQNFVVFGGYKHCGVKELIMFIARANAAITHTMYQMIYPSESNSERFNLFLCHVLLCISVAPYLTRLRDSDSLTNGFLSFFICGRASSS